MFAIEIVPELVMVPPFRPAPAVMEVTVPGNRQPSPQVRPNGHAAQVSKTAPSTAAAREVKREDPHPTKRSPLNWKEEQGTRRLAWVRAVDALRLAVVESAAAVVAVVLAVVAVARAVFAVP